MIEMSLAELSVALAGPKSESNERFKGVSINSRNIQPNNLFIALKGEKFDGHDYVYDAAIKGAKAAIVKKLCRKANLPQLIVKDTSTALARLGEYWRAKFTMPVVGITGSVGKTTVKEMIGSILNQTGSCVISEGNMNNEIGLPLTLFKIGKKTKFVVLEMGAAKVGDIEYLAKLAKPDIGVITCCAPAHLKNFKSLENIALTKGALVSNLSLQGTAILNREDYFFERWCKMRSSSNMISFGESGQCFSSQVVVKRDYSTFCLNYNSERQKINIQHPGQHNIKNALAAAAASFALGLGFKTIENGLAAAPKIPGRLFWIRKKNVNILDDSYNANPQALNAAIDTLSTERGEKWVVFGDMLELGATTQKFHDESVVKMNNADITRLFAIGRFSGQATMYFQKESEIFSDLNKLIIRLKQLINKAEPKVSILIKGSRATNLDLVVKAIREADI